ncbi:hypothetical protein CYMTET_21475 [Cymbomonas tetramitiformis]|uniref:Staygreen protein domain-containing protein n=1 Tax=Cymbomonas tetramitiformis TaxID=36881 RepID=A0AAE0G243_9CHLO|nr:hypothetical protein CYMTET_21475 [Cymbomonas tetramitiformis]
MSVVDRVALGTAASRGRKGSLCVQAALGSRRGRRLIVGHEGNFNFRGCALQLSNREASLIRGTCRHKKARHLIRPACRLSLFDAPPFDATKLTIDFTNGTERTGPPPSVTPRRYTLTHNDWNGELLLSIGTKYNADQISGWYTRFLRDEIVAEWHDGCLQIYCHVGGQDQWWLAPGQGIRNSIFNKELLLVLDTIRYADSQFLQQHAGLAEAPTLVHFHATQSELNRTECWGPVECATSCRAVETRPQGATSPSSRSSFVAPCFPTEALVGRSLTCTCSLYNGTLSCGPVVAAATEEKLVASNTEGRQMLPAPEACSAADLKVKPSADNQQLAELASYRVELEAALPDRVEGVELEATTCPESTDQVGRA